MRALKHFLLGLTPGRAFGLFIMALALGCAFLFVDVGRPWLVTAPVVLYGALLAYSQTRLFVYLNGTLKDSPYFLGFILTLVALSKLFAEIGASGIGKPARLVSAVGEAILATVVGLVVRHLLFSLDASDSSRDEAFQTVMDSVRKNASDFQTAQQQLVQLVREFTTSRETLFDAERAAHVRFVASVTDTTARLGDLERAWPDRLQTLDQSISGTTKLFDESTKTVSSALARMTTDAQNASSSLSKTIVNAADATALIASESQEKLRAQFSGLADALREVSEAVANGSSELRAVFARYPGELLSLHSSLEGVTDGTAEMRDSFESLTASAVKTNEALLMVGRQLDSSKSSVEASTQGLRESFEKSATALHDESIGLLGRVARLTENVLRDLEQADKISGQVIRLLQTRVEQLR